MAFVSTFVADLEDKCEKLGIETNGAPLRGVTTVGVRALVLVMTQSDKPLLHFLLFEFEPRRKFVAAFHKPFFTSFSVSAAQGWAVMCKPEGVCEVLLAAYDCCEPKFVVYRSFLLHP